MKNSKIRRVSLLTIALASLSLGACTNPSINPSDSTTNPSVSESTGTESTTGTDSTETESSGTESTTEPEEKIYTMAEAIAKANESGEKESEPIIIKGKIKSITSFVYGSMYLTDDTGELYIYGVHGENDEFFDKLDYIPMVGDTITLRGSVCMFNKTPEMKTGNIVALEKTHEVPSADDYEAVTAQQAREKADGTKVKLTGVVAKTTLTQKKNPNGFYLVDSTAAFYIFGGASAAQVKVGNTVTVIGEIAHYISDSEKTFAEALGYTGSLQLTNTYVLTNDKGEAEPDYTWAEEKTVKEIMEVDVKDENITNVVYKTNAIIKKSVGASFINYYINDFDGTGSYVYTSNNGSDFAYLDAYTDVPVELYLTVCNYKCTASGTTPRFIPLEVSKLENFTYPEDQVADFAIEYGVLPQFEATYSGDPKKEVITSYSNDILNIDNVAISYESSNTDFAYFEEVEGKKIFHVNKVEDASATITMTATYKTYTASSEITISYEDVTTGAINVSEAISKTDDTEVKVRGIVAQRTINKSGFYLIDSTGAISVQLGDSNELDNLHTGDEVVVTGTKNHILKSGSSCTGQIAVDSATVEGVVSVGNTIPTDSFTTNIDFDTLVSYEESEDLTAKVYTVSAYVFKTPGDHAQLYFYKDAAASTTDGAPKLSVYSSSPSQYEFAESMIGKQVTLTFAFVNWNSKNFYKVCPLTLSDGTTTVSNNL